MRKRTAVLLITLLLTFGISLTASPAFCADCREGGSVDRFCEDDADSVWIQCCAAFGCSNPVGNSYCRGQSDGAYNGCVISLGCPNLAD